MSEWWTSLRLVVVTQVVCVVAYTAVVLGGAALVPDKAEGSLFRDAQGRVIGSRLIAQEFHEPKYLWPRPSAVDYNAGAAGGSNLSPASPELRRQAVARLAKLAPPPGTMVPADLVTASGSGLDPDVSLAAALLQVPRIAAARGLSTATVERRLLGMAEPRGPGEPPLVNVLPANLALDGAER